jgi:hypothetical protein
MNNGAMTDMCAFPEEYGHPREHMYRTVLLHIASVFDDYSSPIPADGGPRAYINIFSNDHIPGYGGLGMNEGGTIDHGSYPFE